MSENTSTEEPSSADNEVFSTSPATANSEKIESPATPASLKKKSPLPPAPTIPKDDAEVEEKIEQAELSAIESDTAPPSVPNVEAVPTPSGAVVGAVSLAAMCYAPTKRNSGSVILLQERLAELGFDDVRGDIRGWYHDHTKNAVAEWQKSNGLDSTGHLDMDQAKRVFAGTPIEVAV